MADQVPDPWKEAQDAAEDLRAALKAVGIMLPALAVDLPGVLMGFPLVSLGVAPADTVSKLTTALKRRTP